MVVVRGILHPHYYRVVKTHRRAYLSGLRVFLQISYKLQGFVAAINCKRRHSLGLVPSQLVSPLYLHVPLHSATPQPYPILSDWNKGIRSATICRKSDESPHQYGVEESLSREIMAHIIIQCLARVLDMAIQLTAHIHCNKHTATHTATHTAAHFDACCTTGGVFKGLA